MTVIFVQMANEPIYDTGFNKDYLINLEFFDGESAIAHVKMISEREGFQISLRDAKNSDRIRIYCH